MNENIASNPNLKENIFSGDSISLSSTVESTKSTGSEIYKSEGQTYFSECPFGEEPHVKMTFPILAQYLESLQLSAHLEEVTLNFTGNLEKGIKSWTVQEVRDWIMGLNFLGDKASTYADLFAKEYIDGECFMELSDREWGELPIDRTSMLLLKACRDGWKVGWGVPVPISTPTMEVSTDALGFPLDLLEKLREADRAAAEEGRGAVYGQLVVLGYKVTPTLI